MTKEFGKITRVYVGMGGYQGVQFGIWFLFEGKGWGCGDGRGFWSFPPSSGAKWTVEDQTKAFGEMSHYIIGLLEQAKKTKVEDLKDIPVECTFEGTRLASWRILEEVL